MFKFFKITALVCLLILAVLSLAGLALYKMAGLHFYSVQTNSMAPLLRPGDLALSARVNPADIRVGDIISYHSLQPGHEIINHRAYKIFAKQGYLVTKGDNLSQPDPPVPLSAITGKTVKVLPKLGYPADFVRRPAGLIFLVYLPLLILAAYELHRLANHFSYYRYANAKL